MVFFKMFLVIRALTIFPKLSSMLETISVIKKVFTALMEQTEMLDALINLNYCEPNVYRINGWIKGNENKIQSH